MPKAEVLFSAASVVDRQTALVSLSRLSAAQLRSLSCQNRKALISAAPVFDEQYALMSLDYWGAVKMHPSDG